MIKILCPLKKHKKIVFDSKFTTIHSHLQIICLNKQCFIRNMSRNALVM